MDVKQAIGAIKERLNITDIVRRYVELKRNGSRWTAPCPFHQETKPSFSVNEEEGVFYCFGCQASGDLISFYQRINGIDFKEAIEQLASEAGISLDTGVKGTYSRLQEQQASEKRRKILRMYDLAAQHFSANLKRSDAEECRAYISKRGLSESIIEQFNIGWARREWDSLKNVLHQAGYSSQIAVESGLVSQNERSKRTYDRFRGRMIFPIKNLSGQIIAFGGRIIANEDEAKYINSSDTPIYKKGNHLYGLMQARRQISSAGFAMLTEGYMDVLTLHQYGYGNAVGVLGTALTPEQIKRISGFTSSVTLLFDGDNAGRKAALRSSEMFLSRGLSSKIVLMPDGEDIDSLLRKHGSKVFDEMQKNAVEGFQFCMDVLKETSPKNFVNWAYNFLAKLELPELFSPYASQLAQHLNLSEGELREGAIARKNSKIPYDTAIDSNSECIDPRDKEIMMYAIRYPHRIADLEKLGADMLLTSDFSHNLWNKIKETDTDSVEYRLDSREKIFWQQCRSTGSPPIDDGEREFEALAMILKNFNFKTQSSSIKAVLREQTDDFMAELECLRVLQKMVEKHHE